MADTDIKLASQARGSWMFPAVAWASQILWVVALKGINLGVLGFIPAIIQAALLMGGLGLAINILRRDPSAVDPGTRRSAWIGLVFSGGTVVILGCLFATSSK